MRFLTATMVRWVAALVVMQGGFFRVYVEMLAWGIREGVLLFFTPAT